MGSLSRSDGLSNVENNMPVGKAGVNMGIYMGIIKDNSDVQGMGRLKVWVPEFGSDEDDENGWRIVSYSSPFAGATPVNEIGKDLGDSDQTQTSYGMWMVPPDLDNQVLVCFLNGDPSRGFWLGCVFQQNMNSSVPEVPTDSTYNAGNLPSKYKSIPMPTSEYNKHTTSSASTKPSRPIDKVRMRGIAAQGLIRDSIRGQSTSTSRRGSPPEVYGMRTPGPINPDSPNKKGRKGGHSLIMDDGEGNEHISIKTRSGAQIRVDETNGMLYFINRDGTGWIQIDEDGNGDFFMANDLSIRALRDINFRADRDVNIEAGRDIAIKATKDYQGAAGEGVGGIASGSGGKIYIEALDSLELGIETDINIGSASFSLSTGAMDVKVDSGMNLEAGSDVNVKSGAGLNMESGSAANLKAGGSVAIDGVSIDLNSGASTNASSASPSVFTARATGAKDDNLKSFEDQEYKFDRNTQSLTTIVGRMPTFEPCPEHTLK